ncbi:MAG TPA: IS110 family transposase [Vicinamibacterales bacterium]|nr:IS110 family transposase [Vicinamibacterales bacterium]
MKIIGCDLHAAQQTIAMLDRETGEIVEKTLRHQAGAVREFYAGLPAPVVVGLEATGSMGWFLQLLHELGVTYRVGHPATIRKAEPRKQKHDRRDAALLLQLLADNRFPAIWIPSTELRDLRALLLHRHQWVRLRTRVQNALHAIALGYGVQRGHALWKRDGQTMLASLPLPPHASHRRDELQALYQHLDEQVGGLDDRVKHAAAQRPRATDLMTHPGVGHVTALATEVFLGDPSRFSDGKTLASYVGMIPSEYSSGNRQRLGGLSKQGNPLLRFLWGEAAMHAVRRDPELRRFYQRKLHQKGLGKARMAAARKLGIRLWIMLRDQIDYLEFCRRSPRRQP